MPADSDLALPRRWRPLGTRLAGWFFGGLFLLVSVVMWMSLGEARKHIAQRDVNLLLGCAVALLICLHALMRCRVDASERGVTVVNGYRRRDLEWAEVVAITMPPGAPWAVLDLADGRTASAMGIQASDGDRARAHVRDLRALIEAHQPGGH